MKARNCQIEFKSNTFSKVLRLPCYYNKTKQSLWKCFHISSDDVKCPETPSCNIYCSWKATGHEASKLSVLNDIAIVPLWMVFTSGGKKKTGISKTTVWSHCIVSEEFGILKKTITLMIQMLIVTPLCVKCKLVLLKEFQMHLFSSSIDNRGQYVFCRMMSGWLEQNVVSGDLHYIAHVHYG